MRYRSLAILVLSGAVLTAAGISQGSAASPGPPSASVAFVGRPVALSAWHRLVDSSTGDWRLVVEPLSGTATMLSGGRTASLGKQPTRAAEAFLAAYRPITGISRGRLGTPEVSVRPSAWHVTYPVLIGGVRVDGGSVSVHMTTRGEVTMVRSRWAGLSAPLARPRIAASAARARAKAAVSARADTKDPGKVELLIVPGADAGAPARCAYKVTGLGSTAPPADWVVYVDAATGRVLKRYNDLRTADTRAPLVFRPTAMRLPSTPWTRRTAAAARRKARVDSGALFEGYEGTRWPAGNWTVYDVARRGAYWDDENGWVWGGGWAAWPAEGGGSGARLTPSNVNVTYFNNMDTWMVYGPLDLSSPKYAAAESAKITFYLWNRSLPGDVLFIGARTGGPVGSFFGVTAPQQTIGWQHAGFDLKNIPTLGNLTGQSNVYLAFAFKTNASGVADGPFVDNIRLECDWPNAVFTDGAGNYTAGATSGNVSSPYYWNYTPGSPFPDTQIGGLPGMRVGSASGLFYGALDSRWVKADNEDGPNMARDPGSASWAFMPVTEAQKDEPSVYEHVNLIHDFFGAFWANPSPSQGRQTSANPMDYRMIATVHYKTDYPNAFYSPNDTNIYFGDGNGTDCRDTAKGRDVIYHEYTHAVTDHIVDLPYLLETGAMSEAYSDYFAASYTNDPVCGEYVLTETRDLAQDAHEMSYASRAPFENGQRDTRPTADWWTVVSPGDVNDNGWVHHNSMIYSGALWDVRESFVASSGLAAGAAMADRLAFEGLFFKPQSVAEGMYSLLWADDMIYGDAQFGNGTPHETQIRAAFARHGMQLTPSRLDLVNSTGRLLATSAVMTSVYGKGVTLFGLLRDVGNVGAQPHPIVGGRCEFRVGEYGSDGFVTYGTAASRADGSVSARINPLSNSSALIFYPWDIASPHGPAMSIAVSIKVAPSPTISYRASSRGVVFTGKIDPVSRHRSHSVQIQRKIGSGYTKLGSGRTDRSGKYRIVVPWRKFRVGSVYRVCSYVAADADHLRGRSAARIFRVVR